jgi:hypothetical protein
MPVLWFGAGINVMTVDRIDPVHVRVREMSHNLQYVRVHMEAFQWELDYALSKNESVSQGILDQVSEAMRVWSYLFAYMADLREDGR